MFKKIVFGSLCFWVCFLGFSCVFFHGLCMFFSGFLCALMVCCSRSKVNDFVMDFQWCLRVACLKLRILFVGGSRFSFLKRNDFDRLISTFFPMVCLRFFPMVFA